MTNNATLKVPAKVLRAAMALILALGTCIAVPSAAHASESTHVTVGDSIPYAGYSTTHMWADGQVAYCADPAADTPSPGTYSKSSVSDSDLITAMWFSYGSPGFDASLFPSTWYDGSSWSHEKYQAASHVLLAYVYQGSKSEAAFGTNAAFESWARTDLLGTAWGKMKSRSNQVSTGFKTFVVHTGSGTQVLVSFTWHKGGLMLAKEDSEAGAANQGDANLEGAKFNIINKSGMSALVGGKTYADGEVVKTITASWDEDAKAYVAKTSADALPCGKYKVVESSAPAGYLQSDWSKEVNINSDGQVVNLIGEPCKDDVIRGGVQVVKSDVELGASEALGGNSHDELDTGSTLSGIEFTIANASKEKVLVNGKWFNPGNAIETITTAWNDDAKAYTAQTASDELPYGTYTIQETKTNGSYLLTDGNAKTFQIRDNGTVVTADINGNGLEFFNQVVRNDLEIVKMAEDTNASLQVAFKVTNISTGEAHVIVTDKNGNVSTASSWNKHSENTNGNDKLLESDSIKASDMDSKAGTWFSLGEDGSNATVNDSLAALPYGKYVLEELRSDSNEGYDLVKKTFVIERDSTVAKAVWMSLDDKEGPKVQTEATDKVDGNHIAQASVETTLVDTVWYENLKNDGTEYTITGTLMVKSTGEALLDADGNPVTATKTFKPKQKAGDIQLEFTFDPSLLAGEDVVAFESLFSEGVEVAAHADIDDDGQTVHFLDIHTTATDASDHDKLVTGTQATVSDEVAFEGLTPGQAYKLMATLMDAETGEEFGGVIGEQEFTAEETDGTVTVEIAFDATGYGGHRLVVFEQLAAEDGTTLATHEDIDDEGQSVTVCEIGTTLTDASDGDHVIEIGKVTLVDTVEYKGLIPGDSYTVNGTLMVKSTGEAMTDEDGKPVTASAEFTAEDASGTVQVTFEFDASALNESDELVAFEDCLTAEGNIAAVHHDLDDGGQTVVVDNPDTPEKPHEPEAPTTPDNPEKGTFGKTGVDMIAPIATIAVVALIGIGCMAYGFRLRKK